MRSIILNIEKGAFYMIMILCLTLALAACVERLNVDTNGYQSRRVVTGKGVECIKTGDYYVKCGERR
jgi:hypothetical protein